ncbi:hypothetical protein, partial [Tenebrionibacter intestinalis]|uniref:hypothetical protein n=1 Tax=Tenebrionibacter intestinalis TaxID=2799638 RepID=UPI001EE8BE74
APFCYAQWLMIRTVSSAYLPCQQVTFGAMASLIAPQRSLRHIPLTVSRIRPVKMPLSEHTDRHYCYNL